MFTTNLFRTFLSIAAIVTTVAGQVLGCSTLASGATVCSASWLTPQLAAFAATVFIVLNLVLKAFQGGTPGSGLVNKTVVVATTDAPGTVHPASIVKP